MGRVRTTVAVAIALPLVLLVASANEGGAAKGDEPRTAIKVDGDQVSTAELVGELRILAANERYARLLKKEDDEKLVPRSGTISPIVASAWVNMRVNQITVDQEFERRGLTVTPKDKREAKRNAAKLFRGRAVFDAFPRAFRERVLRRQERIEALEAMFPATAEPTDAELADLFAQTTQLCEDDKLVAQILVMKKAEAEAITAALAQGADFANLAREYSADPTSAPNGGVYTCIGAPAFRASVPAIQQAARELPVGGTSEPLRIGGGYAVVRTVPFTPENARPLLVQSWRAEHQSPFGDFVKAAVFGSDLFVAERFAMALRNQTTVGIAPRPTPVRL